MAGWSHLVLVGVCLRCVAALAGPTSRPVEIGFVDSARQPLAGVRVDRLTTDDTPQTPVGTADASGRLTLTLDPDSRSGFVAVAPGLAPTPFGFWGALPTTREVVLAPARKTVGRLIDADGKPVGGRAVRARWMTPLLGSVGRQDVRGFTFAEVATTDADGRFAFDGPTRRNGLIEWLAADRGPAAGPIFDPDRPGRSLADGSFVLSPASKYEPSDWRPTLTAPPPITPVKVRVVDALTGRPIGGPLRVTPGGRSMPGQPVYPNDDRAVTVAGPDVAWRFSEYGDALLLHVHADGYADTPTPLIKPGDATDIELRLLPLTRRVLVVTTPDGKPAAGARARVATPTRPLNVYTQSPDDIADDDARPAGVAGPDGRITIDVPGEACRVAVWGDAGSAEVDPAAIVGGGAVGDKSVATSTADLPVRLTAWAAAAVHVRAGGRPLAGVRATWQSGFSQDRGCDIDWSASARTEARGDVMLPRLRAGSARIELNGADLIDTPFGGAARPVDVALIAGRSADATFAAGDKTLRATLPAVEGVTWTAAYIESIGPPVTLPAGFDRLPPQRQRHNIETLAERAGGNPRVRGDGVFRPVGADRLMVFGGLDPGTYRVTPMVNGPDGKSLDDLQADTYVVVPQGGPATIDAGVLPGPVRPLAVGQPSPSLATADLDGKPLDLADFRGRWVLLDFWGTWCPSCVKELPMLQAAHAKWAKDGRLTIVGLSVNDDAPTLAKYLAAHALPWRHVRLGDRADTGVPDDFHVSNYPTNILIAPDGTVAAVGLRDETIATTLAEKLGPVPLKK